MMLRKLIFICTIFCFFYIGFSCVGKHKFGAGVIQKKYTKFGVTPLGSAWKKKNFKDADLVFEHMHTKSIIFVTSNCKDFSDSPLEALTAQLLVGMRNINIKNQKWINLAERKALVSSITASLDGVTRYLKTVVLRKNRCLYDAVLTTRENNEQLIADFDHLINSLWVEAEL